MEVKSSLGGSHSVNKGYDFIELVYYCDALIKCSQGLNPTNYFNQLTVIKDCIDNLIKLVENSSLHYKQEINATIQEIVEFSEKVQVSNIHKLKNEISIRLFRARRLLFGINQ